MKKNRVCIYKDMDDARRERVDVPFHRDAGARSPPPLGGGLGGSALTPLGTQVNNVANTDGVYGLFLCFFLWRLKGIN